MNIVIDLNGAPYHVRNIEDLSEIEAAIEPQFGGVVPSELQAAINAQFGTLSERQQGKTNFQNRLAQLNTAINATNNPLADETVANLAALNRVIARLNTITNILNAILRMLRYIYLHRDD